MTKESLRKRAIRLLARREHTRAELASKLAAHGTEEEINTVIADLEASNLQSDRRFAEAWVRGNSGRLGLARLRQTLRQRGVDNEIALAALSSPDLGDELMRARDVWSRKYDVAPTSRNDWARQARFLQSRGFAADIIRRVVPVITWADDSGSHD